MMPSSGPAIVPILRLASHPLFRQAEPELETPLGPQSLSSSPSLVMLGVAYGSAARRRRLTSGTLASAILGMSRSAPTSRICDSASARAEQEAARARRHR